MAFANDGSVEIKETSTGNTVQRFENSDSSFNPETIATNILCDCGPSSTFANTVYLVAPTSLTR